MDRTKRKPRLPLSFGWKKERDYFIESLSMLLASGMSIIAALDSIAKEIRTARMKEVIRRMSDELEGGSPLYRALDNTGVFPDYVISLVKIGESSGQLFKNLGVVALQEAKNREFRSRIRSAMMYPVLVLSVTLAVGVGIAWFILPQLARVFLELKLELPLVTRVLIAIGDFLGENGSWAVPLFLAVLFLILYFLFVFKRTKFVGQELLFLIGPVKRLMKEVELARFGTMLGGLLGAGLPVVEALGSIKGVTSLRRYRKFYEHIEENVDVGNSFQKCFALYKSSGSLIPHPIQQMIVAGEQSGNLAGTLTKIGAIYEGKTDITAKNLTVLLEPVLLVIVWLGVVAVALGVILPIYSLIGGLNQ